MSGLEFLSYQAPKYEASCNEGRLHDIIGIGIGIGMGQKALITISDVNLVQRLDFSNNLNARLD